MQILQNQRLLAAFPSSIRVLPAPVVHMIHSWVLDLLLFLTAYAHVQHLKAVAASFEEAEALLSIKQNLGDPPALKSWTPATDPCQQNWYGVTCTVNTVSDLNLSNLFLQGSLPSEAFLDLPNLTKLLLANNSFVGRIPESVFQLSNLTQLDLAYNKFSGPFSTGFEHLTKLQVLSLTGNPFRSEIAFDFSQLTQLQYVLLGECGFIKGFPSGLPLLRSLYALDLEDNYFVGDLPISIWSLPKLAILGLQNSGLSVRLSFDIGTNLRKFRYVSLPQNADSALKKIMPSLQGLLCMYVEWVKCIRPAPVPFSPVPAPSPAPFETLKIPRKDMPVKAIIGGVVGGAAFLLLLFAVYWSVHRTRSKDVIIDLPVDHELPVLELETVIISPASVAHALTFRELELATDNFNSKHLVGEGSFGQVFRGVLTNGKVVAIKKMDEFLSHNFEGEKEFRIEVDLLSRLNHPNLVRLFGYCADGRQRLIVYEFMTNGSLESYIEGRSSYRIGYRLDLQRRLRIALGSAKGLAYLHAGGEYGAPIVHRDFKASNILLDKYFNARISDFGFAKLLHDRTKSHASTRIIGTFGYFDPHYTATGHLTVMADVYGFGVVLLQLLTGKAAVVSSGEETPQSIISWSKPYLNDKRKLKRILDRDLGPSYPSRCAQRLALLAACCLREKADQRPTMVQCVKVIEEILADCVMRLENLRT